MRVQYFVGLHLPAAGNFPVQVMVTITVMNDNERLGNESSKTQMSRDGYDNINKTDSLLYFLCFLNVILYEIQ